jgi:hypothetical protein
VLRLHGVNSEYTEAICGRDGSRRIPFCSGVECEAFAMIAIVGLIDVEKGIRREDDYFLDIGRERGKGLICAI